jgi:hypothetical protein|tara:strand:+ start:750 stop:1256 length:507 start_codon:yes stop_codon:yes gene_type:complete
MAEDNNLFDAPIAGQSLTAELGARPWQQAPMYATVEEAFEYYATRLTDPAINDSLFDTLEMGTPVGPVAEILVQSGAMEGKHSIDVSILILPVIMELIAYVADEAGIEYDMGTSKSIDQDIIPESKMELALSKIKNKSTTVKEEEPMVEPEAVPEENPQPSGLMARRM